MKHFGFSFLFLLILAKIAVAQHFPFSAIKAESQLKIDTALFTFDVDGRIIFSDTINIEKGTKKEIFNSSYDWIIGRFFSANPENVGFWEREGIEILDTVNNEILFIANAPSNFINPAFQSSFKIKISSFDGMLIYSIYDFYIFNPEKEYTYLDLSHPAKSDSFNLEYFWNYAQKATPGKKQKCIFILMQVHDKMTYYTDELVAFVSELKQLKDVKDNKSKVILENK